MPQFFLLMALCAQTVAPYPGLLHGTARTAHPSANRTLNRTHRRLRPFALGQTTSTTVASNGSRVLFGQAVTFSASVSPAGAGGSVAFYDGAAFLGSALLSGGQGSLSTALLSFGSNPITAHYSGDANDAPSISPPAVVNVVVPPESGLGDVSLFPAGPGPWAIVAADFDGDGILDLATANAGGSTVTVLLGNGDGTFRFAGNFTAGTNPASLAAADFNGDGKIDLATANSGDDTVSVLLGIGDGTFQSPVAYDVGSGPASLVIGDFSGNGLAGIAVANSNDGTISVLPGNGDGTLSPPATFNVGTGPSALVIADFNGDGIADLASANAGDGTVSVLLGDGSGAFSQGAVLGVGLNPSGITAGDFNGDGKTDLAVANYGDYFTLAGGSVMVMAGNGDGSFQSPVISQAGTSPWVVAPGDLNGDGVLDLTVSGSGGVSVLLGNGDGSFQAPAFYSTGTTPVGLALGAFDGTGLTDVAAAGFEDGAVDILLSGPGVCSFNLSPPFSLLYDASGGTAIAALTANSPACAWSASGDAWIVPAPASGMGGGSITLNVQPNATGIARQGSTGIGSQSIVVSQLATRQAFSDVPPQAYYFDAVNELRSKGVTSGCGATEYCPTAQITRAQMAVFIVRAVYGGDNFTASSQPYFNDVPAGSFGFPWIQKMVELGITSGCGQGLYCPNDPVTRAQMAVFIVRARLGTAAVFTYPPNPYFTDVPETGFAFPWIQRMRLDVITVGCSASLYCPSDAVIRGDMAVFIMRGAFNALMPAGMALVASISPAVLPRGQSGTFTVTGTNTNFAGGQTTLAPIPGVTLGTISVTAAGSLTVQLTADPAAVAKPVSIVAITGSEQAVLPNGLLIQ